MSDIDYDALSADDVANADLLADSNGQAGTYAAAAYDYLQRGWAPIPIPAGKKKPPPAGYTGDQGAYPSAADVQTWIDFRGHDNIAVRMSELQASFDVDAWDGKHGPQTIAKCEADWGPLPATWTSTARGPDDPSRIRHYRLPRPVRFPESLPGGHVEVIQRHHRYAMVAPSVHPTLSVPYDWYGPDGHRLDGPPRVDELPLLPDRWVEELAKLATASVDKAKATPEEVQAWKANIRRGVDPCDKVAERLDATLGGWRDRSRYDDMVSATMSLVSLAGWGHGGAYEALTALHDHYVTSVTTEGTQRRTPREAEAEWQRSMVGAVKAAMVDHPQPRQGCRCGLDVVAAIDAARSYLHLPDPTHLLASMAIAATAEDTGDPVWLLIVAAPSSGKTETIRSLDTVSQRRLNDVTTAGLLSYKAGKKPKPVGVLVDIGDTPSLVTITDLSSLLASSDRGARDTTFATLREVYDGYTSRSLGSAPETLTWEGRLTIVAAVTGIIDRYAAHADALGPRWLYVRLPEASMESMRQAARMARRGGLEEARQRLREAVTTTVEKARANLPATLPEQLEDDIVDAAMVTCWGRGSVPRHGYGRREIDGVPVVEEPGRVTHQLRGLARGLIGIGLDAHQAGHVVRRVAVDSMPLDRRQVLTALATGEVLTTSALAKAADVHRHVARMRAEELEVIGVVECRRDGEEPDEDDRDTRPALWRLAGPRGRLTAAVMQRQMDGGGWHEMWVPPPQPPQKERGR